MNCAEDLLKFLCQWLLDYCKDDMKFMTNQFDKALFERLQKVTSNSFERVTYTEALDLLKRNPKFEHAIEWGNDFNEEHERFLVDEFYMKPVIVYNHPKQIKSFSMRLNDDGKTVASMDVLVPKVGVLISGSQREERYEVLEKRLKEVGLPREPYEWYLDLRKYGTVKHSGFGFSFENLVLFSSGIDNIKDVVPFPRSKGRVDL